MNNFAFLANDIKEANKKGRGSFGDVYNITD